MKKMQQKIAYFLFLAIGVLSLTACNPTLEGTWIMESQNPSKKESIAIVFNYDGTFIVKNYGFDRSEPTPVTIYNSDGRPVTMNPIEGNEIPGSGKWRLEYTGNYETDQSKAPCWIDLIINVNGTARRIEGIFQMPSEDVLQLGIGETVRPADFGGCRNYLPMRRATYQEESEIKIN